MTSIGRRQLSFSECANWDAILPSIWRAILKKKIAHCALNRANTVILIVAQWLASRTTDQRVPGSRPGQVAARCGVDQVTFTPCIVLVKPRKPWMYDWLGQDVTRLVTTLCLMC